MSVAQCVGGGGIGVSAAYNLAAANKTLSADRAAAVKQALVSKGIPAARITDEGFGPEKPIASNDTEDGRSQNRRVELVVLKQ